MPKPLRIATLIAAVSIITGCSALSPITTNLDYSPSDGTQIVADDVLAHNLMLITNGADSQALLIGSISNRGTSQARVSVTWAGGSTSITVPAGGTVLIGPETGRITVSGVSPVDPGFIVEVSVTARGTTTTGPVPVLDGTLPEYAHYDLVNLVELTAE